MTILYGAGISNSQAVRLAVELGVDVNRTDLEGRTAADAPSFTSVRDFLSAQATRTPSGLE